MGKEDEVFRQPVPEPGERLYAKDDLAELYGPDHPKGVHSPMDVWGADAEPNLNRFAPAGKRLLAACIVLAQLGITTGYLAKTHQPEQVRQPQVVHTPTTSR